MNILIRSCPKCGQANPNSSLYCPNCGTVISTVEPVSAPSVTAETFFNVPPPLRASSRRRQRDPAGGAGWAWMGAMLALVPVLFSFTTPVALALWLGGITMAIAGFWQMRHDPRLMTRAGTLLSVAALIAMGTVVSRLVDPPNLTSSSTNEMITAPTSTPVAAAQEATEPADGPVRAKTFGTVAMFRGDAAHTGVHPGPGPAGHPMLNWRFDAGGELYSSAAVSGGILYVGSKSGSLYAIDEQAGNEKWSFELNDSVIVRSSPAIVDGKIYIGGGYALYAIDADTGKEDWRFAMPYIGQSSPTVAGGAVYICSQEGYVYAVKGSTGAELWHLQVQGLVFSSPAVANGMVFIGSDDGNLYAINARDGQLSWTFDSGGAIFAAPAVVGNTVYVSSSSKTTFAIDANTGKKRWEYSVGGDASPAVLNGVVYVGSDDGGLYALDASTGAPKWLFPTGSPIDSSPAVAGSTVYVASGRGLYAVDLKTGANEWSYVMSDTIESSPTVVDGNVYAGTRDGFLYAITGDGVTTSTSPGNAPPGAQPGRGSGLSS
ncbi:MAG TPA: PQQ-binding-like beta-propeller repeat protein [Thermomicrobiales bacterium]|nr:PQQ-binding-like beta-propeller repeat protein [Thermomicrobiales bacterium]